MRTETEIRELYNNYVYRFAVAKLDDDKSKEDIFFGASLALGRTLGKNLTKINRDYETALAYINRLREEGKELPGIREI